LTIQPSLQTHQKLSVPDASLQALLPVVTGFTVVVIVVASIPRVRFVIVVVVFLIHIILLLRLPVRSVRHVVSLTGNQER